MLTVGGLFDGIGLLAYGLHLAELDHRWLCEIDPFRRDVLARRWPGVRIFDDVRAVGAHSAERVDVIAGGFPCKGASTAGKRNGFEHPETVLWREMARAVGELSPRYVVVENVANILALHDGAVWGEVLGDLAALGFDVEWDCFPAAAFGAPHLRDRVIAVATHADGAHEQRRAGQRRGADGWPDVGGGAAAAANAMRPGLEGRGLQGAVADGTAAVADTERDGVRQQSEPERRGERSRVAAAPGEAAADAPRHAEGRTGQAPGAERQRTGLCARNATEWGEYEPAIRRWEAIHGPAPEPLVRRVDDRRAMRVERSRLSALGDGVQVQLGEMVGRHLMMLEIDARASRHVCEPAQGSA